jgi:hypothetical protein
MAVQTNEIFLLVADVVALVLTRAAASGGDLQAALAVRWNGMEWNGRMATGPPASQPASQPASKSSQVN